MASRRAIGRAARGWILGGATVVLAAGALGLTVLSLAHVSQAPSDETVAPVPTFSESPSSVSPTPSARSSYDRANERFIAVDANVLWRGTAGACHGNKPTLERSTDEGATWEDVTPTYLGIAQLASLEPFANTEAEIITATGNDCEIELLRTFTQGKFWAPYPDVLRKATYIDTADAAQIVIAGELVEAPCAESRGLRFSGSTTAVICDSRGYARVGSEWVALAPEGVESLTIDGDNVVLAHRSESCAGLVIARVSPQGEVRAMNCAELANTTATTAVAVAVAVAVAEDYAMLWAGNEWMTIQL